MENVFWTRYNPNKTKKIGYQVKIETKHESQERIKQLDTKFEIKDKKEKKYYTTDKNDTKYTWVTEREQRKRHKWKLIHKWKKDAIDKIVEKEGLNTEKKVDKKFCIFLD